MFKNKENDMNDTGSLGIQFEMVQNSPGWLLRQLGLETELYLYRLGPTEKRCARIVPGELDDNIFNYGRAFLFQVIGGEDFSPIVFVDNRGVSHKCFSLAPDYGDAMTRKFFFTFHSQEEGLYNKTPRDMRRQGFYLPLSNVHLLVSSPP